MFWRKKYISSKIESGGYGVDANPGAGDAILTRDGSLKKWQGNKVGLNYDRAYFGAYKQLHTGPHSIATYKVDIAGSGTAGVAPAWGSQMRKCGFLELINPTAVVGVAQAGGASTITLAAGASAVNDAYKGFIVRITSGTGVGQERFVKSYVGATKIATVHKAWTTPPDNTSNYSVDAQVVYRLVSDGQESASDYFYLDGERHKMLGARGDVNFMFDKEQLPSFDFTFTSLHSDPETVALGTPDFSLFKEPLPVNKANTPTLLVHGYACRAESYKLNLGNKVVYRNVIGGEEVMITGREPSGSVLIEKPTLAQKDFEAAIKAALADEVRIKHGTVAGNIVDIYTLDQLYEPDFGESDGLVTLTMNRSMVPTDAGNDEVVIVCR